MLARASGHGIGKSAFISMLINWGMSTCEDCKVVVTANTDNQLRTKTWPEIIKWSNLAITKEWFTCTATAMYSNDPGHDKRWRADAIPWSEHNTEAFAGLHNERKRIIVVFDEASNIADPHITAFNEGQRNLALALFQRVMAHCPEQYLKMAAEAGEDNL